MSEQEKKPNERKPYDDDAEGTDFALEICAAILDAANRRFKVQAITRDSFLQVLAYASFLTVESMGATPEDALALHDELVGKGMRLHVFLMRKDPNAAEEPAPEPTADKENPS